MTSAKVSIFFTTFFLIFFNHEVFKHRAVILALVDEPFSIFSFNSFFSFYFYHQAPSGALAYRMRTSD